jgi:uncharacterized SAM-binding protein YcdF (DUF218 family)
MTASSERAVLSMPRPAPRAMLLRGALTLVALMAVLAVAAWFGREPLLRGAADLWIISDQAAPADAVAVFGGGLEDRPFAAAEYYRRGLVKKILLSNIGSGPAERLGVLDSHVDNNRKVLLKLGVPSGDIETFGEGLSNTYEEAVALREWAARTGARSVIVPTEVFSTRRVRWMLRRLFPDSVIIQVPALEPPEYGRVDWWKSERGLIGFQNEVLKYVYYRLKY